MKVTEDHKVAALHVPQLSHLEQVGPPIHWQQDGRDWTLIALAGTQEHGHAVAMFDLTTKEGTHLIVGRKVHQHAATLETALNQMHPGLSAAIGDRNAREAAEARTALIESHDYVLGGATLNQLGSDEHYAKFLAKKNVYDQYDSLADAIEEDAQLERQRRDQLERQRRREHSTQWERSLGRSI